MDIPSSSLKKALEARIKLRHYRLLVALSHHRSVTQVAEVLGVSQPSVTRALADIEEVFGMPLFSRTGRGLEPTVAGEVVIARARYAISEGQALIEELESVRAGRQGRLRVGVIPYTSTRVLDAAWSYLFSLRPRIAMTAREDVTGNLLAALHDRALDCAICRFSPDSAGTDDLEQALLYQQQPRLVVAKPSAALLARYPEIEIAALSEMDWIFPPAGTPLGGMIEAIFSAAGRKLPTPALEAYAVRTIAAALSALPRGITILPDDIAQAVCVGGGAEVLPNTLPWSLPPVGLAWLRGSPKTALLAGLREAIVSPGRKSEM
ncbi:LysR family transcriptional regulator [Alicycliphilus denitrificans]|uniref:LysR family transcriptional regulator n=1 Tax=Alicycliphilus denitrificans TaxID=179636 RepID=A0A3R7HX95_9BURK|nr:LysR family transcriptional regulator [Alicycliphilus denitrificans]RKJ98848.1 LysR family transcriptional regulator [Alicycliphilus denitrificans]